MDFLTSVAYWGIAVLVIANAVIVFRMTVNIHDEGGGKTDPSKCEPGI